MKTARKIKELVGGPIERGYEGYGTGKMVWGSPGQAKIEECNSEGKNTQRTVAVMATKGKPGVIHHN